MVCFLSKVKYLLGLDPAGPLFTFPIIVPSDTILTKNDANWVQVIHTSLGTYGASAALGDADFYVNGGFLQPSCVWQTTSSGKL